MAFHCPARAVNSPRRFVLSQNDEALHGWRLPCLLDVIAASVEIGADMLKLLAIGRVHQLQEVLYPHYRGGRSRQR